MLIAAPLARAETPCDFLLRDTADIEAAAHAINLTRAQQKALRPIDRLRVATWNLNLLKITYEWRHYSLTLRQSADYALRARRFPDLLKELLASPGAPDVVFLQEAWNSTDRDALVRAGVDAGFTAVGGPDQSRARSGLLLLVRRGLRLEASGFSHWGPFVGFERMGAVTRGLLWARLRLPSGRSTLIATTHLTPLAHYVNTRVRQLEVLRANLAEFSPDTEAAIVGGDFNIAAEFSPERGRYNRRLELARWVYPWWLESSGLRDAFRSVYPRDPGYTFDPAPLDGSRKRLDYIFLKEPSGGGIHVIDAAIHPGGEFDGIRASDHFPLFADLDLF